MIFVATNLGKTDDQNRSHAVDLVLALLSTPDVRVLD